MILYIYMKDNNSLRPKKLSNALLAMFDPKKRQEKQKEEKEKDKDKEKQPIKIDSNQANNIKERFDKMLEEKNEKEENKKNEIEKSNQINTQQNNNSINLVKNTLNQFTKKEEEDKQKKIQEEKEKAEREEKKQITIKETAEKQKAKLMQEEEQRIIEEEKKIEIKQEKINKEKEWRKKMDEDRTKGWSLKDEAKYQLRRICSVELTRETENTNIKIMLDLSSSLCNCFIYGNGKETKNIQLKNFISYYKDTLYDRYGLNFCDTIKHPAFPTQFLYPIKEGTIPDFEIMEYIISYIFKKKINFPSYDGMSLLFIEPYNIKREEREYISKLFFEEYNFGKVFMIKPSILTLIGEGKSTGIVIELDDDKSNFIPIFDCFSLPHAIIRTNLGRKDINNYMNTLLVRGYTYLDKVEEHLKDKIEDIVKKSCYIALDYDNEFNHVDEYKYDLPDYETIFVGNPRIQSPEILFKPWLNDLEYKSKGIHINTNDSIKKCDEDIYNELYNNIVLTGINSQFRGMKERMEKEMIQLVDEQFKNEVKVTLNEQGIQKGVEAFFSNPAFDGFWITKEEYDENSYYEDYITARKCF